MAKFTVILTKHDNGKEFNFQVPGWISETKCEDLADKHGKEGYLFRDVLHGLSDEIVSCNIHKRLNL